MKINKKYVITIEGFCLGVVFYLFDLIVSNSETSSVEPISIELLRNINYSILFIYGFLGFIVTSILVFILIKLNAFKSK